MALGSLSSWTCNFIVGMFFTILRTYMKAAVFLIFAIVCFALAVFVRMYLPETRGKDISEITQLVDNGFRSRPVEQKDKMLTRINNELST
jgi:SP family facilitated glucose transporter-like MFS transporter 3